MHDPRLYWSGGWSCHEKGMGGGGGWRRDRLWMKRGKGMERWAVPLPKSFRRPPPSVTADSSSALSTHSVTSFIYCSSLSRLIPHLSFGLSSLSLLPPSLAVPLSSFHSFSHSLTLSLSPSATACMAFTLPATDLFTCNPSLPVLRFFFGYTCQCCLTLDCSAVDHIEGKNGFWSRSSRQKVYSSSRWNNKKEKGWHLCCLVWDCEVKDCKMVFPSITGSLLFIISIYWEVISVMQLTDTHGIDFEHVSYSIGHSFFKVRVCKIL